MTLFAPLGYSPKLVICDLDGTLVDSAADIAVALSRALDDVGLPQVTEAQVRLWVGKGASRLVSNMLEACGHDVNRHDEVLDAFLIRYESAVCEVSEVYEGVLPFLKACREHGVHLAVATNKPYKPAIKLLTELNLIDYFDLVIGGDSTEHKKPHPGQLLHCLHHFSVRAEDALMVGDSLNDVAAAKAASIPVVALPYGYNHGEPIASTEPTFLVDSLTQLI